MTPRSRTLFHFTKSRETLKLILKHGFWPRYCPEDVRWLGQADAKAVAFPMVCFCDIPLSRISDHVNFYGQYGLGMTRDWALKNGLNPILYISGDNGLSAEMRNLNEHFNLLLGDNKVKAKESMRYVYAHSKPASGVMVVDGNPVEKDFYLESEWRLVPRHKDVPAYIRENIFDDTDKLANANEKTRAHCMLRISPSDVKYIFAKSDADIPDLINFLQTELDHHSHADVKVLMSRVTSLESIQGDI